ncbi:MAG: type II secretion system protein [Planctomycetes bacterium]|nr:type II secretion system protein [Planctomycetota bacterium]
MVADVTDTNSRATRSLGAFSLIELLVVIAVTGLLLAIGFPVIRGAIVRSEAAVSLARCGQCVVATLAHAQSNADRFPLAQLGGPLIDPAGPTAFVELADGQAMYFSWFGQTTTWNWVLVAMGEPPSEMWRSPSRRGGEAHPMDADYRLTNAVMAARSHWRPFGPQESSMWAAQRVAGVARPSAKALMWESADALKHRTPAGVSLATPRPVAFADGHAAEKAPSDARPGVFNRFINAAVPLLTTEDGVAGWDFQ